MNSTESTVKRRKRQSGGRTATGCLCCRLRHKKCDEVKPTCGGCWRNSLICSWPEQGSSDQNPMRSKWKQKLLSGSDDTYQGGTKHSDAAALAVRSQKLECQKPSQAELLKKNITGHPQDKTGNQKVLAARRPHAPLSLSMNPAHLTLRDPNTCILFAHYSAETASLLCTRPDAENPFVSYVLPRAYTDSLIMSAVIALSGVHFCHNNRNYNMQCTTWTYYAQAIRGLKHELAKTHGDRNSVARLLFATILLCHIECVSGNSDGAIFYHLRASRQFVLSLMKNLRQYYGKEELSEYAFLIEVYSYLASISNITFNSISEERAITYDASVYSVNNWTENEMDGVMFGCASALFQLIPQICQFGRERFFEETQTAAPSDQIVDSYKYFQAQICGWKPPLHFNEKDAISGTLDVANIYQEALLIYLHAGFYASDVLNSDLRKKTDASIIRILFLMESIPQVPPTVSLWSTILWPFMMVGSCLTTISHKKRLLEIYRQSPCKMAILDRAVHLLDLIWEQDNNSVFGPYGMEMVMKQHKINFCMG
ncbi:hypothetical protein N431DRAFT_373734 [Stipitochalara longipes BDJ]|nr:hypothetical protein N431DRAFT_373734 [Stipitochalara longipes BDJ]